MPTNVVHNIYPMTLGGIACTSPAVPAVGDPVRYGTMTGIAVTPEAGGGNPAAQCTVDFGCYIATHPVTDHAGTTIAIGDPLFIVDGAPATIENDSAGRFYGFALATVGNGATTSIRVLHVSAPGSGTLGAGTIATANLAAGLLSADANGRAKMAASYFDTATVLAKFAANSFTTANMVSLFNTDAITNAVLLQAVLDGAFQNDAATRALFADAIWTEAKLAAASLTGLVAAVNATENVIGSIPVYHRMTIADVGAPTDYTLTLTHKTLITNWWIQNTGNAAHNTDDTINLKNVAASLSGAVPKTNVQYGLIRPTTLNVANTLVTAGTNLVVTATKATNIACVVHILGVRSA